MAWLTERWGCPCPCFFCFTPALPDLPLSCTMKVFSRPKEMLVTCIWCWVSSLSWGEGDMFQVVPCMSEVLVFEHNFVHGVLFGPGFHFPLCVLAVLERTYGCVCVPWQNPVCVSVICSGGSKSRLCWRSHFWPLFSCKAFSSTFYFKVALPKVLVVTLLRHSFISSLKNICVLLSRLHRHPPKMWGGLGVQHCYVGCIRRHGVGLGWNDSISIQVQVEKWLLTGIWTLSFCPSQHDPTAVEDTQVNRVAVLWAQRNAGELPEPCTAQMWSHVHEDAVT